MKAVIFLAITWFLFVACNKNKKDVATVSLPFVIETLSKTSVRQNDTLVITGHIFDNTGITNNTQVIFNTVPGTVLKTTANSVVVLVPLTTTGLLTLKQNGLTATKNYTYIP